jgi:hypothetical protein
MTVDCVTSRIMKLDLQCSVSIHLCIVICNVSSPVEFSFFGAGKGGDKRNVLPWEWDGSELCLSLEGRVYIVTSLLSDMTSFAKYLKFKPVVCFRALVFIGAQICLRLRRIWLSKIGCVCRCVCSAYVILGGCQVSWVQWALHSVTKTIVCIKVSCHTSRLVILLPCVDMMYVWYLFPLTVCTCKFFMCDCNIARKIQLTLAF